MPATQWPSPSPARPVPVATSSGTGTEPRRSAPSSMTPTWLCLPSVPSRCSRNGAPRSGTNNIDSARRAGTVNPLRRLPTGAPVGFEPCWSGSFVLRSRGLLSCDRTRLGWRRQRRGGVAGRGGPRKASAIRCRGIVVRRRQRRAGRTIGRRCLRIEQRHQPLRRRLSVASFNELSHLTPVNLITIEPQRDPTEVAMVRRRHCGPRPHSLCVDLLARRRRDDRVRERAFGGPLGPTCPLHRLTQGEEDILVAGSVGCLSHVTKFEARSLERDLDLLAAAKAECRVGRQRGAVRLEHDRAAEGDQRQ